MALSTTTVGAQEASAPIFLDWRSNDVATVAANLGGGTMTYSLQGTLDNVLRPGVTPVWTDIVNATGKTADFYHSLASPYRAVRANVTAWTSGTLTLKVMQKSAD